ncbi:pyruvate dehydrogenase (acetyl-transferring) E1 component subunit alpha [Halostella salina]|uniref:pyruvate dehydrogenase (acetyl-transferring) E1 component subunit alpha n=1 Tax=Halostella salina TaxID=1547897 RepID=UPI000EF78386|nr:pyruvate dehydrogenase (acetyl-transferring) E1 component subunit alpha [Halostella salina]
MPRERAAEFTIDHVQALDEAGNADPDLLPDLSTAELRDLYRNMRRARRFDERAVALQRRGEIGTIAPAIGQEAVQVASAAALSEGDWMVPSFRESAAYLTRGVDPHLLLWYAMGMEEGAAVPEGEHTMPPSIAVGSQTLHGAGLGWGQAITGDDDASLVFFGDGASSEGDAYEAFNVAGVFDAHTVFLCQNNRYAISVPRERQTRAETIAQKAVAAGIDGVQVDGNDVLGTYKVVSEALEQARQGEPVVVEALTYRRSMHTTADDPSVYRTPEEEAEWAKRDPIDRYEDYLREEGVLDDDAVAEIEDDVEEELEAAIERAREGERDVDPAEMFDHAFAELSPWLADQREAFERHE